MEMNITSTSKFFKNSSNMSYNSSPRNNDGNSNSKTEIVNTPIYSKELSEEAKELLFFSSYNQVLVDKNIKKISNYLKKELKNKSKNASDNAKLGELVIITDEETDYTGELSDYTIDKSANNIFTAA